MNYEETLSYIHSVSWKGSRPGLERISELLSLMGNPQDKLKYIHVAGTNGKGSFCAMTASVLKSAGYKTGLFISPYIWRFNERMSINDKEISDGELSEITDYVRPFADKMKDLPTEFELITAIAFEYFARNRCDYVVLEVGMGGRLDSTNVIKTSELSVITGIALDHMAYLGDTVEKIAAEKSGIIKANGRILFGGNPDRRKSVADVILKKAEEMNANYYETDYSRLRVIKSTLDGAEFSFSPYDKLKIPLAGIYQPQNAATVITAAELLREGGLEISDDALCQGLSEVKWRGRFEVLCKNPLVISDGGHNPEGVAATIESVKAYFPSKAVNILTGVMADKDYSKIISLIGEVAHEVFTVTPDNNRALSSADYAAKFTQSGISAHSFESIPAAVKAAAEKSRTENIPLICLGSLYMYAEVRSAVEKYQSNTY